MYTSAAIERWKGSTQSLTAGNLLTEICYEKPCHDGDQNAGNDQWVSEALMNRLWHWPLPEPIPLLPNFFCLFVGFLVTLCFA